MRYTVQRLTAPEETVYMKALDEKVIMMIWYE
jgi:hypothetical protein